MRVYLIIDETGFYHPNFVARFLEQTKDEVVGAALITKVDPKNNIGLYLMRHWYYLRIPEMIGLVYGKGILFLKDLLFPKKKGGSFYSVKSVFRFYKIDYMEVEYDINKPAHIEKIKEKYPDVIISSCSTIFGTAILSTPKICCLNRHSALLPSYGGLFPVLQAYRSGEEYTGVSIHTMESRIDKGRVLAQKEIPLRQTDTIAKLYEKCFTASVDALLEALDKVRVNDFRPVKNSYKPSYFSFPSKEQWRQFRQRGGRFI